MLAALFVAHKCIGYCAFQAQARAVDEVECCEACANPGFQIGSTPAPKFPFNDSAPKRVLLGRASPMVRPSARVHRVSMPHEQKVRPASPQTRTANVGAAGQKICDNRVQAKPRHFGVQHLRHIHFSPRHTLRGNRTLQQRKCVVSVKGSPKSG